MIRIGVLGAGHFAEAHMAALGRLRDRAQVTLVARRHLERPFPLAEAAGAAQVTPGEIIASSEIDAVSICLPNNLHRHYVEAALRAGKHVFCEKPLALSLADADVVIDLAQRSGKVLKVGHLTRFLGPYVLVQEALASGRLGCPLALRTSRLQRSRVGSWRMDAKVGGGAPFDLLVHDFDLLNWYLGPPTTVSAVGHKDAQGAYDHTAAILTYPTGAVAVAEGSFLLEPPATFTATMRVLCERGMIEVDFSDHDTPVHMYPAGGDIERPPMDLRDSKLSGITEEFREFLDAIDGKDSGRLRLDDARLAVQCAVAVVEACDMGRPVSFARV